MKFSVLQKLASKVSKKIGQSVSINAEHWSYSPGRTALRFTFYAEHGNSINFLSPSLLKEHMERIINPPDKEDLEV